MSAQAHCLDNIIGLSETQCDCFDQDKPLDYNVSNSSLFLDQLEGINLRLIDAVSDCEQGSIWDMMAKARTNAISDFKNALITGLTTKYKYKRQPFSGTIGSDKFTKSLSLSNTYAGRRIYAANIISGVMSVRRIGILMDADASFDIDVYDSYSDTAIAMYSVSSVAKKLTWFSLATPLVLSMNSDGSGAPEYYFIYQRNGFSPMDSNDSCGCSSGMYKYYWNTSKPQFRSYEKDRWNEYIMITGITGNDIYDLRNWSTQNYTMGILLDVEFKCKVSDLICKESLDFEYNPLALTMAHAVRYNAGAKLIDTILASGDPNRYTMTDRERLMGKKNTYTREFLDRIGYLTEQINYKANDCLACNDFDDIIKVGIFS